MKENLEDKEKLSLKKLILIYDFIPYEIILIIQQAAFVNELNIINMIDNNKALRYYLDKEEKNLKSSIDIIYITIIIIYDNKVNISVYTSESIRKLFNKLKEKTDIFKDLKFKNNENYILLDDSNSNIFLEIKKYISDLMEIDMGIQYYQDIGKIYIFNTQNLMKELFLGAANSLNYERTQECMTIFKIIDLKYKNTSKEIGLLIGEYKYNLNNLKKDEICILLEEELLFEDCFYKTIELCLFDIHHKNTILINIYFNQINYYYISLDLKLCNSIEMIFFEYQPQIDFKEQYYKSINYEEKFEDEETFRRINLINIDREKINLNLVSDDFNKIFSSKLGIDYQHLTLIIGKNLNILSYYSQNKSIKKDDDIDLNYILKPAKILSSKLSLKELEGHKKEMSQMVYDVNYKLRFMKKLNFSNIANNTFILVLYGKYIIFKRIFEEEKGKINYNEDNQEKFKKLMEKIENFHEKCKNYIKNDDLSIAQLFLSACLAFDDFLKNKNYSDLDLEKELIDLIDFKKKGTIYNAGYENNLELIKNLKKDSFLYPIFLQFYSGYKLMKNKDGYYEIICKISKITLEQIKLLLIKSLNRYGIRIFFNTNYLANTSLDSSITSYNETKIFGKKLDDNELLISNDINYHKRTSISFLQKNERFCHLKSTFNKIETNYLDSPRGYLDFCYNKIRVLISSRTEDKNKGEFGEAFEYFLTNGKRYLIDNLFRNRDDSFNFINLFNINLLLDKNNENLINNLILIPANKEEENKTVDNNESDDINDSEDNNKSEDNNNNDNKNMNVDTNLHNKKYKYEKDIKETIKKNNNKNKNKIVDDYIQIKNNLINNSISRKYTFEKNTICNYKFDKIKKKLVPDNKYP